MKLSDFISDLQSDLVKHGDINIETKEGSSPITIYHKDKNDLVIYPVRELEYEIAIRVLRESKEKSRK